MGRQQKQGEDDRFGFSQEQLATLPSNAQAIESAQAFTRGKLALLAVEGPTGWGKTEILRATERAYEADQPRVFCGDEFLARAADAVGRPVLIDNAQDAFRGARKRVRLQFALERRVRANTPTMLALTVSPGDPLRSLLPHYSAWTVAKIKTPTPVERLIVVDMLSAREGLTLSYPLRHALSHHLGVTGRAIEGALKTLRVAGTDWKTDYQTLKACGLLHAHFTDDGRWDLRSLIQEVAEDFGASEELAIYTMRHRAVLQEADVASFYEMDGGAVFKVLRTYRERVRADHSLREHAQRFASEIVERIGQS